MKTQHRKATPRRNTPFRTVIGCTAASLFLSAAMLGRATCAYAGLPTDSPVASPTASPTADSTCQLLVSDSDVNYPAVTKHGLLSLPGSPNLGFPERIVSVTAACDKPMHMALKFTGRQTQNGQFSFGDHGILHLQLQHAQLDGQPIPLRLANPRANGTNIQQSRIPLTRVTVLPGDTVVPGAWMPIARAGKQWTLQMALDPQIPASAAQVTDATNFVSDISVELITQR